MDNAKKLTIKYLLLFLSVIVIGCSGFIAIANWVTSKDIIDFDQHIISFVQSYISDDFTPIMITISFFASIKWIAALVVLISGILCWRKKWSLAIFLLCASGLGGLLNKGLKWFFKRERPDILPLVVEQSYSFPSGHSMGAILFYGSLAFIIIHLIKSAGIKLITVILMAIFILSIGISRIYLGVHYPTDVLGGYSIGIAFLYLCILCFHYYEGKTNK
ncbi:phosphatase PAP2 family protein [Niallia sp. 03133]|uniref:phosphatase PAP2 family protein n=1 Tax=Niallia sp. 03133 TaxID=3458060 RepID=UPI0040449C03